MFAGAFEGDGWKSRVSRAFRLPVKPSQVIHFPNSTSLLLFQFFFFFPVTSMFSKAQWFGFLFFSVDSLVTSDLICLRNMPNL